MRADRARRRGTILFEVVVGLTVLAIAGIAWISLLAQTRASIADVRVRELNISKASDAFQRYRFLDKNELDARLGTTRVGALFISVSALAPHVYALAASDSLTPAILLSTSVYAREPADSAR